MLDAIKGKGAPQIGRPPGLALAGLDRHLKQNDSKISMAKDREFVFIFVLKSYYQKNNTKYQTNDRQIEKGMFLMHSISK